MMRSVKFYCLRKEHWEKMTVEGFGAAVFVVFVLLLFGGGGGGFTHLYSV